MEITLSEKERQNKVEERLYFIDIMRGWGIIIVIFGHALQIFFENKFHSNDNAAHFWKIIYSFHMPLFFFVSGLTLDRSFKSEKKRLFYRVIYLLMLCFVSQVLLGPFIIGIRAYHGIPLHDILREIFLPIVTASDYKLVVTWFLTSLALLTALWGLTYRNRSAMLLIISSVLFFLYVMSFSFGLRYFQIHNLFFGWIFLLSGVYSADALKRKSKNVSIYNCICLLIALLFILQYMAPLNVGCFFDPNTFCGDAHTVDMNAGVYGFIPVFLATAFIGIFAIFFLSLIVEKTAKAGFLTWVGRNTLPLLFMNGFFLIFVQSKISAVVPTSWVTVGFVVTAGIVVVLIHLAALPFFAKGFMVFERFCSTLALRISKTLFRP